MTTGVAMLMLTAFLASAACMHDTRRKPLPRRAWNGKR
jgi:hypothetical protein